MLGSRLDFAMREPKWIISTQNKGDHVKKNYIFNRSVNLQYPFIFSDFFSSKAKSLGLGLSPLYRVQ